MGWLLAEDAAIKRKLTGLTVSDINAGPSGRPVKVRYRMPETELATATFPMIIIDRQSILRASEREHRGKTQLMYSPESHGAYDPRVENPKTSPFKPVEWPVPFDINYAVTIYSRKEQHNMELVSQLMMTERLPARFGYLEVPEDHTVRSLFLEGGPEFEVAKDRDDKRIFYTHYIVRIPTEIPPTLVEAIYVTGINIDIYTPLKP